VKKMKKGIFGKIRTKRAVSLGVLMLAFLIASFTISTAQAVSVTWTNSSTAVLKGTNYMATFKAGAAYFELDLYRCGSMIGYLVVQFGCTVQSGCSVTVTTYSCTNGKCSAVYQYTKTTWNPFDQIMQQRAQNLMVQVCSYFHCADLDTWVKSKLQTFTMPITAAIGAIQGIPIGAITVNSIGTGLLMAVILIPK
jgi:hypothetical protein